MRNFTETLFGTIIDIRKRLDSNESGQYDIECKMVQRYFFNNRYRSSDGHSFNYGRLDERMQLCSVLTNTEIDESTRLECFLSYPPLASDLAALDFILIAGPLSPKNSARAERTKRN